MLKIRNGRSEGHSLSMPLIPPKSRQMAFLQSGDLLLRTFLNKFRQKRPFWKGSIFHRETSATGGVWFAADAILFMEHLPWPLKLVHMYFFLFPSVEEAMDVLTVATGNLNTAWGGPPPQPPKKCSPPPSGGGTHRGII